MTNKKQKILIITGQTASGKTAAAIEVAKKIDGEIVSADSMQIYKYLDIGTSKPDKQQLAQATHHMIDICHPNDSYSVAQYSQDAQSCIDDILSRGKTPIVTGGTGLYINSLLMPYSFGSSSASQEIRNHLHAFHLQNGADALHDKLAELDPTSAEQIHKNNVKRVMRALEIVMSSGKKKSEQQLDKNSKYDYLLLCIQLPRQTVYQQINRRVDIMMEMGLLEEVNNLRNLVNKDAQSMQAIGYKQIIEHLDGEYSLERAVELIKQLTRNYAKRQMTWFRKMPNIVFVDKTNDTADNIIQLYTKHIQL